MTYIIRDKTTKRIIRTSTTPLAIDLEGNPTAPKGLSPELEIITVVKEAPPSFDPATQKLLPKEMETDAVITKGFEVIDLSAEELEVRAKLTELMPDKLAARLQDLEKRLQKLEAANGQPT